MIIVEKINEQLERRYSDSGRYLKQIETGFIYGEAIDLSPCEFTYEETDEPVETD